MIENLARRLGIELVAVVLMMSLTSIFAAAPASAAPTAVARVAALSSPTLELIKTELRAYATTEGGYSRGGWSSTQPACWACDEGGPATAAATTYVLGGASNETRFQQAEQTINYVLGTRQGRDGGFSDPGSASGDGIQTMWFGVELGTTYQLLAPHLNAATKRRWKQALAGAADYTENSGNATWYANGNINLGYAELFYLAWKATGRPQLLTDYNNEWAFMTHPPQHKFPGSGLVIAKAPTKADGSDGRGYLTEAGPGGNGYDPEYTMLQLDEASRLYLLSGDPRALRLANLEMNMLLPRLSTTSNGVWLNTSDGTRHTQPDRRVGLQTSAAAILALFDGRSRLASLAATDLTAEANWFKWANQDNPVFRRALGNSLATAAIAEAMYAHGATMTDQLKAPIDSSPVAAILGSVDHHL